MITNFTAIQQQVASAIVNAGRDLESVKIVGVSKRQPVEKIVAAVLEGLRCLGENQVQETLWKRPEVEKHLIDAGFDVTQIRWHMVGHLQSNKAVKAAELFDVIQSVDSIKLASKLSHAAMNLGKSLEALIEVNVSEETTKSGIHPDELVDMVGEISALPGIMINGLMTIGPHTDNDALIRTAFEKLRDLNSKVMEVHSSLARSWELSMGMSDDYPLAIAAGATIVRIGTAIFGPRMAT
ncbi:MAG: YggS family pyridoxal phosphate-dependent enzyme [Candidatus Hatepunaea meridiana]|nr:YggS family pyridoxal phosphate-dependent enzyme [Candidatus Hatepunaea meridiana]